VEIMKILITGGAGNLGKALAAELRGEEHGLHIFDLPHSDFSFYEGWEDARVFKGDILDPASVRVALDGVDMLFHLAAILPPASEVDKQQTLRVNVDGTRVLLEALSIDPAPCIVFASSVSVYGDTSRMREPVGVDHPVNPNDWYAESKVACERLLHESGHPYVNLRISGIAIPEFLDPPEPWPFMGDQRIELMPMSDLVHVLASLVAYERALNKTLIIAGGPTWQVTGEHYVRRWGEIMEIPFEEMSFQESPGWLNWYDTAESQKILNYQKTSLEDFFGELQTAVAEALSED
jgi:nucleoside-diphosphate-sugar epimerase